MKKFVDITIAMNNFIFYTESLVYCYLFHMLKQEQPEATTNALLKIVKKGCN